MSTLERVIVALGTEVLVACPQVVLGYLKYFEVVRNERERRVGVGGKVKKSTRAFPDLGVYRILFTGHRPCQTFFGKWLPLS